VLVVGGGCAGMRAAIAASDAGADVAIISKLHPVRSHSGAAEGGINAALGNTGEDSPETHAFDTVKGSDYLGDQDAIEIFTAEAPGDIYQLEHWGCYFTRNEEGKLAQRPFGAAGSPRTIFAADITGHVLIQVLYEQVMKREIPVYEEFFAWRLVEEDGACVGVVCWNLLDGGLELLSGKSVVLATGGAGRIFRVTTNAYACTGDGMAMALRAGLPLKDMEFMQYHPTTLYPSGILLTEGCRGEGAYLINSQGDRFMATYAPNAMELASRDVVSRSEQTEIDEGRGVDGCVYLDMRHLGEDLIKERLEEIYEIARDLVNIDIAKELLPILPGIHYAMGGVKTDVDGLTPMPGLYSAGEAACVSVHGANRVGANSLLDTIVFGRRAAEHAVPWIQGKTFRPIPESVVEKDRKMLQGILDRSQNGDRVAKIRRDMGVSMNANVGLFRSPDRLAAQQEELKKIRSRYDAVGVEDKGKVFNTDLLFHVELGFMIDCADMITTSAIERKESRGAHTRLDFPNRDDENWLKHIVLTRQPDGSEKMSYLPVTITQFQPQERKY